MASPVCSNSRRWYTRPAKTSVAAWIAARALTIWCVVLLGIDPHLYAGCRFPSCIAVLSAPQVVRAARHSLSISFLTALGGGALALLFTIGIAPRVRGRTQRCLRACARLSATGLAIPLAWAGVAVLSRGGLVAAALAALGGAQLGRYGLRASDDWRLSGIYLALHLPLLLVQLAPTLITCADRRPMNHAGDATQLATWLQVIPVILETLLLLFGSTCAVQASTAVGSTWTGGTLTYALVDAQRHSDVPVSPILGVALGIDLLGMHGATLVGYSMVRRAAVMQRERLAMAVVRGGRRLWKALVWCLE